MKTGLLLEGGAMRGLYTAGILDVFMEKGIKIDGIIGVSAGALFGMNYKSKQIYVADMGHKKVIVLDYDTGEILDYINIDGNPQGLQISNDYKLLFISDTKNNLIKIYNTLDNILLKDIKVGKEPTTIICM